MKRIAIGTTALILGLTLNTWDGRASAVLAPGAQIATAAMADTGLLEEAAVVVRRRAVVVRPVVRRGVVVRPVVRRGVIVR